MLTRRQLSLIRRQKKLTNRRVRRHRLFQRLEDRRVLATVAWDGGGNGTLWHDPANWVGDQLPSSLDDVIIDVPGSVSQIIFQGADQSVASITTTETLSVVQGVLDVSGTIQTSEPAITLNGGTIRNATIRSTSPEGLPAIELSTGTMSAATLQDDAVLTGGLITIKDGLTLDNSQIRFGEDFNPRTMRFDGTQTILGSGSIAFPETGGNKSLVVFGADATLTIGQDILVSGSGVIRGQSSGASIVNRGTITAGNGQRLTLGSATAGTAFVNRGSITANDTVLTTTGLVNEGSVTTVGGEARFGGIWSNAGQITTDGTNVYFGSAAGQSITQASIGNFQRSGGTVNLEGVLDNSGGHLQLNATTGDWYLSLGGQIIGGSIETIDGAQLIPAGGTLDGVTLESDLSIGANSLTIRNGLVLDGVTLRVGSDGNDGVPAGSGTLIFDGDQTLSGTGQIIFPDAQSGTIQTRGNLSTFILPASIPISGGRGTIRAGANNQTIINQTEITTTNSLTLGNANTSRLFLNQGTITGVGSTVSTYNLTNEGTLETTGGTLNLWGDFNNTTQIDVTDTTLNLGRSTDTFTFGQLGTVNRIGGITNLVGTLDNQNQTLLLDATTGDWNLPSTGRVLGGTIDSANGSRLVPNAGTLDGVTLDTDIIIAGSSLSIVNGVTINDVSVHVGADSGQSTPSGNGILIFNGTQSIVGSGQFLFPQVQSGTIQTSGVETTLTLPSSIGISGGNGTIRPGGGNHTIVNETTIAATGNLTIGSTSTGRLFINRGVIRGTGATVVANSLINENILEAVDGVLRLSGQFDNSGQINFTNTTLNLGSSVDTFSASQLGNLNRTGGTVNLVGTLDNANQRLELNATTGDWILTSSGRIQGGQVDTIDAARLIPVGGTLDAVTLQTDLSLDANGLSIVNGLTLDGVTITVGRDAADGVTAVNGALRFIGTQALSGTGNIRFPNDSSGTIQLIGISDTLTLEAGVSIGGGTGVIRTSNADATIINQTTITAEADGKTIQLVASRAGGQIVNQGTIQSQGGDFTTQRLFNEGVMRLAPGTTLSASNEFELTQDAILELQINGTGLDHVPQLVLSSALTLDGTLRTQLTDGFVPAADDVFDVATFTSSVGDFDTVTGTVFSENKMLFPILSPTSIQLVVGDVSNENPLAVNDQFDIVEDTPSTIDVLLNDSDPDGDMLQVEVATDPQSGQVSMLPDGTVVYTPDADFTGTDVFTYRVTDGRGGQDFGVVQLNVIPVNDAPVSSLSLPTLRFDGIDDVVIVDDAEILRPQQLTVEAWIRADQSSTYDSVLMKSSTSSWNDGYGIYQQSGQIHFFVSNFLTTRVSAPLPLDRWTHIAGRYDGNSIVLFVDGIEVDRRDFNGGITHSLAPLHIGQGAGSNSYTWDGNLAGIRLWNLALSESQITSNRDLAIPANTNGLVAAWPLDDGVGIRARDVSGNDLHGRLGRIDQADLTITDRPAWEPGIQPVPLSFSLLSDRESVLSLAGSDIDGDEITARVDTLPLHGSLFQTSDGSTPGAPIDSAPTIVEDSLGRVVYQPDTTASIGSDSFTYSVADAALRSSTEFVSIRYVDPNSIPVAINDSFVTPNNTPVNFNVLDNDTDDDEDTASLLAFESPASGTLQHLGDGLFQFVPATDFVGQVTFDYLVTDQISGESRGTVTIDVVAFDLPNLVAGGLTGPAFAAGDPATISISYTVTNMGSAAVTGQPWTDQVFVSFDQLIGDLDDIPVAAATHDGDLAIGQVLPVDLDVTLPAAAEGSLRLYIVSDLDGQVIEFGDDSDNRSEPIIVDVTRTHADLVVSDLVVLDDNGNPETRFFGDLTQSAAPRLTVQWTVTNEGIEPATGGWIDRVIASDDAVLDPQDIVLAEYRHDPSSILVPRGAQLTEDQYSYRRSVDLRPIVNHSIFDGRVYLFAVTDANDEVYEGLVANPNPPPTTIPNQTNNAVVSDSQIDLVRGVYSDLQITSVTAPTTVQSGIPIDVSWMVANVAEPDGHALAATSDDLWTDTISLVRVNDPATYRDAGNFIDTLASVLHNGGLGVGQAYATDATAEIILPDGLAGTFYLAFETNSASGGRRRPYEFIFGPRSDRRFNEFNNNVRFSDAITVTQRPLPNLLTAPSTIVAPDLPVSAGSLIDITWTETNSGSAATSNDWTTEIWLREVITGGETPARIRLGSIRQTDSLQAGQSVTRTEQFRLPPNRSGVFQVEVINDVGLGQGSILEEDENDNVVLDADVIEVRLPDRPDLIVRADSISIPNNVSAGAEIDISFVVRNQGSASTGNQRWFDEVYLSLDETIGAGDVLIYRGENGAALPAIDPNHPALSEYLVNVTGIPIPLDRGGDQYVLVKTDADDIANEFPFESNNVSAEAFFVTPIPPVDLVTSHVVAPDQAFEGNEIEVRYRVTNRGVDATSVDSWVDSIWLTTDRNRPSFQTDYLLEQSTHVGFLDVGDFYERTVRVTLPTGIEPLQYFITPWTNWTELPTLAEQTRSEYVNPDDPTEKNNNNYKARPIDVAGVPLYPDLSVASVVVTDKDGTPIETVVGGETITVTWEVTNIGTAPTPSQLPAWTDRVVLTQSGDFNSPLSERRYIGSTPHTGILQPNESYSFSQTLVVPPNSEGSHVFVETQHISDDIDRQNDQLADPTIITPLPPADLRVTDVQVTAVAADGVIRSGEDVRVHWTVTNFGNDTWDGTKFWTDSVYFSGVSPYQPGLADFKGSVAHAGSEVVAKNESYTAELVVTLPAGIPLDKTSFDYFFHVRTSATPQLVETYQDTYYEYVAYQSPPDYGNDWGTGDLTVVYSEPDLVVSSASVQGVVDPAPGQAVVPRGGNLNIAYQVTNEGTRAVRQSFWADQVFLSQDAVLDQFDVQLGILRQLGRPLGAGQSYDDALSIALPVETFGEFYVLIYTDAPARRTRADTDQVQEFLDEDNNIVALPVTISNITSPDLQVRDVALPAQATQAQTLEFAYRIFNDGADTPDRQRSWTDVFYLSRDVYLDPTKDRYLGLHRHSGGLTADGSIQVTCDDDDDDGDQCFSVRIPNDLNGAYYLIVATDLASTSLPTGRVFELGNEDNNITASPQPIIINPPAPADLSVDPLSISITGGQVIAGGEITIDYSVTNEIGANSIVGRWADAVYLSADGVWDLNDLRLGHVNQSTSVPGSSNQDPLDPGESYVGSITAVIPPVRAGNYRLIVRTDIFDEIAEGDGEGNNQSVSIGSFRVETESLVLGTPVVTTLAAEEFLLYELEIPRDQTIRITLDSDTPNVFNNVLVRYDDVPKPGTAGYSPMGPIGADATVLIPDSQPGRYYVLVRNSSAPDGTVQSIRLFAESVPLSIADVHTDRGGDGSFVTLSIRGTQFDPDATLKLIRPQFGEVEAERYEVIDSTHIRAVFDLTGQPRGLYDVSVTNPDGESAVLPYRFLIQRRIEGEIIVGIDGPRVLKPGKTGFYSISIENAGNIDAPYTVFQFGVPQLGTNNSVFGLDYVTFSSNLRGSPPVAVKGSAVGEPAVPWAQLRSEVSLDGNQRAPGVIVDLAADDFAAFNFSASTYPGLLPLIDPEASFAAMRDELYARFPQLEGQLENGPEDLDDIIPGLTETWKAVHERNQKIEFDPCDIYRVFVSWDRIGNADDG